MISFDDLINFDGLEDSDTSDDLTWSTSTTFDTNDAAIFNLLPFEQFETVPTIC